MSTSPRQIPADPRFFRVVRPLMWLVIIAVVTTAGIFGYLWWDDAPLRTANQTLVAGDAPRALQLVQDFLKTHPSHNGALALKARALVATGRYDDALDLFAKVGPVSADELHACATACMRLQQWTQAVELLDNALVARPDNPKVLDDLITALGMTGRYKAARGLAVRLTQSPDHAAQGYTQLGLIERNLGNRKGAIKAWSQAVELDPQFQQIKMTPEILHYELGQLFLDENELTRALKQFDASIAIQPLAVTLFNRGMAHQRSGNLDQAVADWKRAIEIDPAQRQARERLAEQALSQKQPEEAQVWLRPIISAGRYGSLTTDLMAQAAEQLGQTDERDRFQQETQVLRKREEIEQLVEQILGTAPQSGWAQVFRSYRFAEQGNWRQSELQLQNLPSGLLADDFVKSLLQSIQARETLPRLDQVPVEKLRTELKPAQD